MPVWVVAFAATHYIFSFSYAAKWKLNLLRFNYPIFVPYFARKKRWQKISRKINYSKAPYFAQRLFTPSFICLLFWSTTFDFHFTALFLRAFFWIIQTKKNILSSVFHWLFLHSDEHFGTSLPPSLLGKWKSFFFNLPGKKTPACIYLSLGLREDIKTVNYLSWGNFS